MKKNLFFIIVLLVIFTVACSQEMKKEESMKNTEPHVSAQSASEQSIDTIGDGLENTNNVQNDLSTNNLSDLDSGLSDIQTI